MSIPKQTSSGIPKVTVLMTVLNGEQYLPDAIESILQQTFHDFELIIVNDGSTDSSQAIIQSYDDPRIRVIHNPCNRGIYTSANIGLRHAQGQYVARLDADDVSVPDRLKTQIDFMEKNPDIGAVASWMTWIDKTGHVLDDYTPQHHAESIYYTLNFANCMPHSSALYRKVLLDRFHGYQDQFSYAGDFDLWQRLSKQTPLAMIKSVLVHLHVHMNNVSFTKSHEQHQAALSIVHGNMQRLLGKTCPISYAHILNDILADLSLHHALAKQNITIPKHPVSPPHLQAQDIDVFQRNVTQLHHAISAAMPQGLSSHKLEKIISQKDAEIQTWIHNTFRDR
jgi:GT2 family glycosyltransferase